MAREKKHKPGPGELRFGPYDPNLKPERSRVWVWWVAGGVLLTAVAVEVWIGISHKGPVAPPETVSETASEGAVANEAAVTAEEVVVPEVPSGPEPGPAVGEEGAVSVRYGAVRIVGAAPDYAGEYLKSTPKRFRLDTNAWGPAAMLPHTPSTTLRP